jgi:hypothetical protein
MNVRLLLCRLGFHQLERLPGVKPEKGAGVKAPYEFVCVVEDCDHRVERWRQADMPESAHAKVRSRT